MASLSHENRLRVTAAYMTAGALAAALILPLAWIILTSIKPTTEIFTLPPIKSFSPTLDHYKAVFVKPDFLRSLMNTLVVSLSTAVVTIVVGALAAYSMARYRFGGNAFLYGTLAIRALPPIVLGLPMFILFTRLGLIDTLTGLTLAYTAFMLPNTIWLMLAFFQDIPKEIEEAGFVDGCGRFGVFWRISLPMARSGIIVTGFYNLVGAWNHFFYGLTLSMSQARTLPVTAAALIGEHSIKWGEVSAMGTLLLIPPIVVILLIHKKLAGGLMLGGVKG
jgi:multiple sugar transport system permease protein